MENQIESKYLEKVQSAYFEYFKNATDFPILVLNLEDKDFVSDSSIYQQVKQLIEKAPIEKKVHYCSNDLFVHTDYM